MKTARKRKNLGDSPSRQGGQLLQRYPQEWMSTFFDIFQQFSTIERHFTTNFDTFTRHFLQSLLYIFSTIGSGGYKIKSVGSKVIFVQNKELDVILDNFGLLWYPDKQSHSDPHTKHFTLLLFQSNSKQARTSVDPRGRK